MPAALPPFPERVSTALLDWRDDTPVASAFGDVYFSRDGGIAETAHVFLDGNGLPARFSAGGFRAFTVGETGFGTGLNFLVAADTFLRLAPADAVLHFVSVERFPLAPEDLARAHAHWPSLAALSEELRRVHPPAVAGFHRRELCHGRIRLTLLLGEAAALLPRLEARIDAWFLDGFAPAKNSDLWTPELFGNLARLSAPGATFATFTAAGEVKRGLAAAGFTVEKVPGFGRKRDMLRGQRTATVPAEPGRHPVTAAVIGGGLAGCAAARALAGRGMTVSLYEQHAALATETSGNIAGAVHPKFSVHETAQNRWYRDSYLYALARLPQLLGTPDGERWQACGLLQLPDEAGRIAAVAASERWPPGVLQAVAAGDTAALTGIALERGGIWFPGAAWVHPPALCRALADHPGITLRAGVAVQSVQHTPDGVLVDGERFDVAVIANALAATTFPVAAGLPLRRVRGQVSHVRATPASTALHAVICHEGYLTPARSGLHSVGATFAPRDADPSVRSDDHAENLDTLRAASPVLHALLGGDDAAIEGGRTGFRTQTPDYLPVIGAVPDAHGRPLPGLYVLAALGARGIACSLLGAEMLAAHIGGEPLPVDSEVAATLAPARFAQRAMRTGRH